MLQEIKDYANQQMDKKIAKLDANKVTKIHATVAESTFTWRFVINKR